MIGLHAVEVKGYFDVEVTCEGPLAKPPQSCFLDGVQVATGATLGKRTIQWVQADRLTMRIKNTGTGKIAVLRPTPALLELLASFKPQPKAVADHGHEKGGKLVLPDSLTGQQTAIGAALDDVLKHEDDEQLEAIARKIAAMPDEKIAVVAAGVPEAVDRGMMADPKERGRTWQRKDRKPIE